MRRRNKFTILAMLMACAQLSAQDTLTLDAALEIALQNNLQISIARVDAAIAENNNYAGNAGMLPSLTFNAGDTPAQNSIRQEFATGDVIERERVNSNALNANLTLSYTLFDGARMFAAMDRLEALDELGQLQLRSEIQNTLSNVIRQYALVVSEEHYLRVLQRLSEVSLGRLELTRARRTAGLATEADELLAQLDHARNEQVIRTQEATIRNAYADLANLLRLEGPTSMVVSAAMPAAVPIDRGAADAGLNANPEYQQAGVRVEIAQQLHRETAAARWPRVTLSASYGYVRSQSEAGFSLYNQSYGPAAMFGVSIPLFQGNVLQRNTESARLAMERSRLEETLTIERMRTDYEQAWELYTTASDQVEADEANVEIAGRYLRIVQERYDLGQATVIDLREAQRSYEETSFRLISNRYLLKLAETDILRLTGQLVR